MLAPEACELLVSNLDMIERAVSFAARRYRLTPNDAEEFGAIVQLRLVEHDYAVLRAYEERAKFSTYISIVVQRMALDYCVHLWGKWHASAEAKRHGPLAVELEQQIHRDGRTLDQALVILARKHPDITRQSLQEIADRLPERAPRHRDVDLDKADSIAGSRPADVEEPMLARERRTASEQLSATMSTVIAALPEDERLILQLRFEGGMTVPQIARSLGLDQKLTYKRIERRMHHIRDELERSGVAWRDVADLIGRDENILEFDLGTRKPRPSKGSDETAAANGEDS
jgi:RNA polymerase sigma factor (sigma-70 family)